MADLEDIFKALMPKKIRKQFKKKGGWLLLWEAVRTLWRGLNRRQGVSKPAMAMKPSQMMSDQLKGSGPFEDELQQARSYAAALHNMAQQATSPFDRDRLHNLALHVDDWWQTLFRLVQRVSRFQNDPLLQRDLKAVPDAIRRLEKQLADEQNAAVLKQMTQTLQQRQAQWQALEKLQSTMRLAEVKIESTVAMLGTIYSQAHMSQSQGQIADYRRLLEEVDEEALALQDYLMALDEVKLGQSTIARGAG